MPLTRAVLDEMGCGTPNCGHDHTVLYLHQACHSGVGTRAAYDKRNGVLTIRCRRCEKVVAEIAVAAEPGNSTIRDNRSYRG